MSANWGDNTPQPRPQGPGAVRWQAPVNEPWNPPLDCPYHGEPDRCCVFSFSRPLCAVAEAELAARITQTPAAQPRRIDWFSVLIIVLAFAIVGGFFLWLSLHPTVVL